jgi:hypothetical protein
LPSYSKTTLAFTTARQQPLITCIQMQIAVSFRNATWKIRAASSMTSPAALLYRPFEPVKRQATSNPSWTRLRVLRRDRYRCRGCGEQGDEITLGIQPIHPAASSADEILTLCARCQNLVNRCNIAARDGSGFLPQLWRQLDSARATQSPVPSNEERAVSRRACS